jgi:hypothetical protein
MPKTIGVVGGGAAGIMCAASIVEQLAKDGKQAKVIIFEKNVRLGVKVAISGGGRCNVTTGINDEQLLLSKYIRGSQFLKPSMKAFPPTAMRDWLSRHGLETKVEADGRVFPVSDIGEDVVAVFERIFKSSRVEVLYRNALKAVTARVEGGFKLVCSSGTFEVDTLVLTTGGNAYRSTGSTGDGYAFAQSLGHSITQLGPSLNSFEVRDSWIKELMGLSFANSSYSFSLDKKPVIISGSMIFTHFGISGPNTFALAAQLAFAQINKANPFTIRFIPIAGVEIKEWDQKLTELFNNAGSKILKNTLTEFFPERFVKQLLLLADIDELKKTAQISKQDRSDLARLLGGGIEISLIARRTGDEFVTAGGVSLDEVDRKTMRSQLNYNLYFAGEILNIDGLTGGYNLQAAWATGRMAGISIAKAIS